MTLHFYFDECADEDVARAFLKLDPVQSNGCQHF